MRFSVCKNCNEYKMMVSNGKCNTCVNDSMVLRRRIDIEADDSMLKAIINVSEQRNDITWSRVKNTNAVGEISIQNNCVKTLGTDIHAHVDSFTGSRQKKFERALQYCIDKTKQKYQQ